MRRPDERFAKIRDFYSACAGRPLELDEDVYRSEKATGSRNRAIAYMLDSFGVLADDPDEVLDVYFRQCSLRVTSADLARMGATLARGGVNPQTGRRVTSTRVVQRTLSVMVTCGMYNAAGDWVSAVGMPAKSGVGGRHRGGAARPARHRGVLAAAGRPRQQCARSSVVPQSL